MHRLLVALVVTFLLIAQLPNASAAGIVDTAFVADAQARGVLIWDARDEAAYRRGHISGAVNVGDALRVLRNPVTEDFIDSDRIAAILGAGGIDPGREIVVYATRGAVGAYFAQFTLRYFGGENISIYHDGIDGWTDDKKPVETNAARVAPIALKLVPKSDVAVTTSEIVTSLRNDNIQILDVRTRGEFNGTDVRAIRGGHVPGAINIPYEQNWIEPDTAAKLRRREVSNNRGMSLRPDAALRSLYSGLDPTKETIVYCQSGVRASETAAVLRQLGFHNVKVYDSSWLGYAAKLDAPVAGEVFFNVGAMNSQISTLQDKIDSLERELAAMRAANAK